MEMSIELNGLKWSLSDELALHIQSYAMITGLTVAEVFERMARAYLASRGPEVQQLLKAAVAAHNAEQVYLTGETKFAVFMVQSNGAYLIQHEPTVDETSALVAFTGKLSPIGHDDHWRRWPPIYLASYSVDRLTPHGLMVRSWKRLSIVSDQYALGKDEGEQLIKVDFFTPIG